MGFYDNDFDLVVRDDVPVDSRGPKRLGWLRSLVAGVKSLYAEFMGYRSSKLYDLNHTGQVYSIENVLNDVFDPVGRRIYITDPASKDVVYMYRRIESKPVYMYRRSENKPVYMYRRSETSALGFQFIIHVPTGVTLLPIYDVLRLQALVDKYRLPGKGVYTLVVY
jgi:hypothetical protein